MEKFKSIVLKLLFPYKIITFFLTVTSAVGLFWIFTNGMETHPVAYAVYLLSFYTLCVVIAGIPFYIKKYKSKMYSNPYTAKYLTEKDLRIRTSLYNGTIFNLTYAVLKLMAGIYFKSMWIGAVSVYYIVLFVIRFLLITNDRKSNRFDNEQEKLLYQWNSYRISGGLMFLLNAAITGMTVQMIWQNKGYNYPGVLIYAMAAYTFYRLTMAIVQNVKMHKSNTPVLAAAKAMDLSVAMMSVFALQTAMFSAFGTDMGQVTQRVFNIATGGFVCISVLFIAVMMVIHANNEILKIKNNIKK